MMKTAVLLASSLILASCATHSDLEVPPAETPAAKACDPRLVTSLEAEPLVAGSIIQPVTQAEVAAVRDHLTSDAEARSWGRRGWDRAGIAKEACEAQK